MRHGQGEFPNEEREKDQLFDWAPQEKERTEKTTEAKQANRKVFAIVNRALLERMRSYQPHAGVASSRPNAFRVAFYLGAVMVLAVVVPSCLALLGQ